MATQGELHFMAELFLRRCRVALQHDLRLRGS